MNVSRQLEELRDRLAESERVRAQQQRELDDLTSSQDDAGKNVGFYALSIHCSSVRSFYYGTIPLVVAVSDSCQ